MMTPGRDEYSPIVRISRVVISIPIGIGIINRPVGISIGIDIVRIVRVTIVRVGIINS